MDIEHITTNLNIEPTKVKKRGEPITSKQAMKDDSWWYEVKFNDLELDTALDSFLNDLKPSTEFIRTIAKEHEVYIFFSLRSNLGQLGFELKTDALQALAAMNIRCEVHIFSYGEVEET